MPPVIPIGIFATLLVLLLDWIFAPFTGVPAAWAAVVAILLAGVLFILPRRHYALGWALILPLFAGWIASLYFAIVS